MPDLVNNGAAVDVYTAAGHPDSLHVEPGQTVTVPGDVLNELGDAYLIGTGGKALLWPKDRWQIKTQSKQPSKKDASANTAALATEGNA